MNKRVMSFALSVAAVIVIAGCGGSNGSGTMQGATENEILTTKAVDQDKTLITVRVEFGAGQQENLEEVLEYQFPDVDIVLQHDGSTNSLYTMKANLEAGVECDLILSRRLPVVEDIASDYLLDLSSEDFVNSYYTNAVESCTDSEGSIYYLPGPSDVYGIVYDKTMFEENGWEVPHSYSEFVALLDEIRGTKVNGETIEPFEVSLMYPDMFQILFNTYGFEDVYEGAQNYEWLCAYQEGEGSMVGHMESAVADFEKLFDDGILSTDSLTVTPAQRSKMLYQEHSTAMIIECQNALSYEQTMLENARASAETEDTDSAIRRGKGNRQANAATETEETEIVDHEIAMMPFWTSDSANGDYLYAIPSYYMAINKASAEESDEKKQLLLDIYSYLSSVEGQEMLIGDSFQMSSIEGVELNENDFSKDILATIAKGNVINTFYLAAGEDNKQVERQLLSGVEDLVENRISVTNWLSTADAVRDDLLAESIEQEETSYGQVETTLTRLETAYTVAQMYKEETGAQIGLCRAGGWSRSTNGYLYGGSITDNSLECITPDKEPQEDDEDSDQNKIVTATMTGKQILDILNSGAATNTKGTYIYYVAAGLDVEFAPWADEGKRVISCKLPDGSKIDQNATYTVAYFNGSLPDDSVKAEDVLDMTWKEAFLEWLDARDGKVEKPDMTLTLDYE